MRMVATRALGWGLFFIAVIALNVALHDWSVWALAKAAKEDTPRGAHTGISVHAMARSTSPPKEGTPRLKGCTHVYLDVGSNVGVQIRKLFEPRRYPRSENLTHVYFNRYFGGDLEERKKHVCAFGFEANPRHAERLKKMEKCYNSLGWRTKIFAPVAIANKGGEIVNFTLDLGPNNWQASVFSPDRRLGRNLTFSVPTFDLADFVLTTIATRERDWNLRPFVLMKMDIEGSEYPTMASMLVRGALYHINLTTIEFHSDAMKESRPHLFPAFHAFRENLLSIFGSEHREELLGFTPMRILKVDDETYYDDEQPLPCKKRS